MWRISWLAWLACLSCTVAMAADLVRDGTPVGEFILSADATRPEVFAVTDVRHWIEQITGARVPIVSEPTDARNTKVFVGKAFAHAFENDLARLADNDGYAIRNKDGHIYVFGSRPRATMYGVFALLERNSDIIWARPNERFGTVYGKHDTLTLADTDVLDIPVFWYRSLGGGHPFHVPTGQWQLRNRNNQAGRGFHEPQWDLMQTIGTNISSPMAEFGETHPEYFGYDPLTGKRKITRHGEGTLCLSHPHIAELWANQVIEQIREREARTGVPVDVYFIGPGDNWFCCQCEDCLKPIQLPGGGTLAMKHPDSQKDPYFRSTQIFMFYNEAMRILKKQVPHVRFAPLAYIHVAEPPAVEIDPDLLVYFAPYPTNTMHFPLLDERQSAQWRTRFETWLTRTDHLGFYEYFYSKPTPLAFYAAANLRALLDHGGPSRRIIYSEFDNDRGSRGIGENALGWDVGAMNTWVIARLFWDPTQDVDELYRYYIRRTYREAAPQMLEYYQMVRQAWIDSGDATWDGAHGSIFHNYKSMIIDRGHEARTRELLAAAEKAAATPQSRIMIQRMRDRFQSYSNSMGRLIVAHIPELAHDGHEFRSVQWEKPQALTEFSVSRRYGEHRPASQATSLKAGHDDTYLYVRLTAHDTAIDQAAADPLDEAENWPRGDYAELWFVRGHISHVFAFDCNGNRYDARQYDRAWDSGWRLSTRKTDDAWEAIAVIPLEALGLEPGKEPNLKWMLVRHIDHGREQAEEVSFKGVALRDGYYPIVLE